MLRTATAALVSIGFTACSEETFVTQNTPVPANGYKFSIPASMGSGDTRAIAYNSETGGYDATFETSDRICVYNVTKNAEGIKYYQEGEGWETAFIYPDANGKKANLCGVIDAFTAWNSETGSQDFVVPEVGDELMLFYNSYTYLDYNRNYSGNYYMSEIADYAIATVKITSINDGVIETEPSSFWNPQSIYKVNFTGIGSEVKIKKVIIGSEQHNLVRQYNPINVEWPNSFGDLTYTYGEGGTDQHELIFMLRYSDNPDTSGDVFSFLALGSDGHYYKGTKSVTTELKNGKYYQAEVAMEDAGLAMTLTNNTTGELVELNGWTSISTKDAAYTAANVGFNNVLEWNGGDNTLTFKNLTLRNDGNVIRVFTDESDIENTRKHHLILDGENILCSNEDIDNFNINNNSSLIISGLSGGKLIIEKGGMHVFENSTMTIESGEIIVNSRLGMGGNSKLKVEGGVLTTNALEAWDETSSCVISKDGKLRIAKDCYVREGFIKAASGYVLNTATEGDYIVYTVKEAPAPKDLSTVTTADLGSIVGSDGKVYVPNCGLPEGVTAVGMIANISSTGHGLAVANKLKMPNEWGGYDEGFTWDDTGDCNNGKTSIEIFDDWKATNGVAFGTWRFATAAEWQKMALSCRIDGDATKVGDEMVAEGLASKLKESGFLGDGLWAWTGEPGEKEGLWIRVSFANYYWDAERQESNYGPYKLNISKWVDPGNYYCILPVLEF